MESRREAVPPDGLGSASDGSLGGGRQAEGGGEDIQEESGSCVEPSSSGLPFSLGSPRFGKKGEENDSPWL